MKHKQTLKGVRSSDSTIKVDKSLDKKYKGKILFSKKTAQANKILSKLKNPLPA